MKSLLKKITALPALPLAVVLFGTLFLLLPSVAYAGWEDYVFAPLEWAWGAVSKGLVYIIVAPIAEALASFFGYLLIFSSTIFEVMLNTTVIGFGTTLTTYGILDGIRLVWSAFRDIANIVIIGMFVFVAISMILGNMTYGTKKFVAKILTVAILINFSLLFTQLVVDASHIAASQFYRGIRAAAVNSSPIFQEVEQSGGEQAFDTAWNKQGGVAGAFINNMGISGFGDTYKLVAKAGTQEGLAVAVFYSLTMIAILIATSAVFLYGAYLLTARAILLIVLLATAALAFASWIVPKYGEGKYGWDGWLTTLIQTSVFAPLLMILLWASIVILSQVGKARAGSMGSFLQNPTSDTSASSAIVVYLFTLGMLFLSFKIASSFSHKITGFSIAGQIANWPFKFAGQNLVGRPAKWLLTGKRMGVVGETLDTFGRSERQPLWKPQGIAKALAQFGARSTTQALRSAKDASFSPGRLPQALDEKYENLAKRFGKDMGKGGVEAADKRAEETAKRVREEAHKEQQARMENATKKPAKEAYKEAYQVAVGDRESAINTLRTKQAEALEKQTKQIEELQKIKAEIGKTSKGMPNFALEEQRKRSEEAIKSIEKEIKGVGDKISEAEKNKANVTSDEVSEKLKSLKTNRENDYLKKHYADNPAAFHEFVSTRRANMKKKDVQDLARALSAETKSGEVATKKEPPPSHLTQEPKKP